MAGQLHTRRAFRLRGNPFIPGNLQEERCQSFDALKKLFEGNLVIPEEKLPKEIVGRMRETRQKYMLDDEEENGAGDNVEAKPNSETGKRAKGGYGQGNRSL